MPTETEWEAKKSVIHDLYMTKNLKLRGLGGLIEHMENAYSFSATKSQYETKLLKWGFKKKRTKGEWVMIARQVQERNAVGKDSVVLVGGQVVPEKKLRKEIQRYSCCSMPSHPSTSTDAELAVFSDIRVTTPELSSTTVASSRSSTPLVRPSSRLQLFQETTFPKSWHDPLPILSFASEHALHPNSLEFDQIILPNSLPINEAILNENWTSLGSLCHLGSDAQRKHFGAMAFQQAIQNINIDGTVPPELLSGHSGSTSTELSNSIDVHLIKILVYLVSNDMVDVADESHVLNGFLAYQDHKLLRRLLSSQDITAESTVANLVRYAFNTSNARMAGLILSSHPTVASNLDPKRLMRQACQQQSLELVKIATELGGSIAALRLSDVLESIHHNAIDTSSVGRPLGRIRLDVDFTNYLMNHGSRICSCISHRLYAVDSSCLGWAVQLGSSNLVELLLSPDWKAKQCPECFRVGIDRLQRRNHDHRHMFRLFVTAGVSVDVAVAAELQNIDALRQSLQRDPRISYDAIGSLNNCDDLRFILEALQLFNQAVASNGGVCTRRHAVFLNNVTDIDETDLIPLIMANILALPRQWVHRALNSLLRAAVNANSTEFVTSLIDHGAQCYTDTLHNLSTDSHPELVKILTRDYLVRPGLGTRTAISVLIDTENGSYLHRSLLSNPIASTSGLVPAIMAGKMDLISRLLEAGVCVNYRARPLLHSETCEEMTALEAAVRTRRMDLVELLLAYGALPFDDGALRAAVVAGDEILKVLLERALGSSSYRRAGFGIPALQLAIEEKNTDVVDLLLRNHVPTHQLYRDTIPGHFDEARGKLTSPGPYPAVLGNPEDHVVALHTAIREDRSRDLLILKRVLESTPKEALNTLPAWRREISALECAIKERNDAAVNLFLDHGVDPDIEVTSRRKGTPLNAAVANGDIPLVKKLIERGASVNSAAHKGEGYTALQTAAIRGHIPIARHLIRCGADVDAAGSVKGGTALELAAGNGRIDMVHLLVQEGAQLIGSGSHQFERTKEMAMEGTSLESSTGRVSLDSFTGRPSLDSAGYPMVVKLLEDLRMKQIESQELVEMLVPTHSGLTWEIDGLGQTTSNESCLGLAMNAVGDDTPFESCCLSEMDWVTGIG